MPVVMLALSATCSWCRRVEGMAVPAVILLIIRRVLVWQSPAGEDADEGQARQTSARPAVDGEPGDGQRDDGPRHIGRRHGVPILRRSRPKPKVLVQSAWANATQAAQLANSFNSATV